MTDLLARSKKAVAAFLATAVPTVTAAITDVTKWWYAVALPIVAFIVVWLTPANKE